MVWDRPHVESLDPSSLPWQPATIGGLADGLEQRVLSADPTDGAATLLLRLPPGWQQPRPWAVSTRFDLFVLDGAFDWADQRFQRHDYSYRATGYPNGPITCQAGAVALVMTYGRAEAAQPGQADDATIPHLRLQDVPRRQPLTDKKNMGIFSRTLRLDPLSGERLFVTGSERSGVVDARIEWHPVVEEIFRLGPRESLDYPDNRILMEPGWYCYRPPRIPHGGFETWEPADVGSLVRVDATLINYYVDLEDARRMWRDYPSHELDACVAARLEVPE
jgi:hypothetical protein